MGDNIENIYALTYPGAERPTAYINGLEIVPLLKKIPDGGCCFTEIAAIWSHIPSSDSLRIIRWLYEIGVLIPGKESGPDNQGREGFSLKIDRSTI